MQRTESLINANLSFSLSPCSSDAMQRPTLAAKVQDETTGHDRAGGLRDGAPVRGAERGRPSAVDKGRIRLGYVALPSLTRRPFTETIIFPISPHTQATRR